MAASGSLGTVQLDYNLPGEERLRSEYIGPDNKPHRPVMIHRAPLGSMERFIGVLIEHFAGAFPLWLAPEQVRVLTVTEKAEEYGRSVERQLRSRLARHGRLPRGEAGGKNPRRPVETHTVHVGGRRGRRGRGNRIDPRPAGRGSRGRASPAAIEKLKAEVADKTIRQVVKTTAGLGERGESNEY